MNSRTESTAAAFGAGLSPRRTAGSGPIQRRSVLKALGIAGVALGSGLGGASRALAAGVTPGDVGILRFVAAAEILESDLWVQYTELAMGNAAYNAALMKLDGDCPSTSATIPMTRSVMRPS